MSWQMNRENNLKLTRDNVIVAAVKAMARQSSQKASYGDICPPFVN